jgi:LytS/YehU family sensor histidine kinase
LTLPLVRATQRVNLAGDRSALRVAILLALGLVLSAAVSLAVSFVAALGLSEFGLFSGQLVGIDGGWVMVQYRFPHDVLACLLLVTAGVARDYFVRYRSRLAEATLLRTQLAEARLQVLRTQLNPHFLFNTLNAVAALVQTDPRGVRQMIALLSDMLRETLDGASETEVPLERELELVRRYVAIMEIRFRGRLETHVSADDEVMNALVPHLILQPLVENSMKHGIGDNADVGRVEIRAALQGHELVLTVRDSGAGRAIDRRDAPQVGGFGLKSTKERLLALYGSQGTLELRSLEEGGTVVEVRLPFHSDDVPLSVPSASRAASLDLLPSGTSP